MSAPESDPQTRAPAARAHHHATSVTRDLGYQPGFDGLRCLGTIAVILGHSAGVQPVLGGFNSFVLVDIFFVVSGYLITTLLLRERGKHGSVSLRAFYVRRIARLYPLLLVILTIALIQRLAAPASAATPSWLAIVSIPAYFTNFAQIIQHEAALNSWGPLWSLAVEEQFYLVWPLVLIFVLGPKVRLRAALALTAALTVSMWVWRSWSWHQVRSDPDANLATLADGWHRFYYSTLQRPDGILIGCALALLLALPPTRVTRVILEMSRLLRYPVVAGIIVILAAAGDTHSDWQIYYGLATFNLLMALLILDFLVHPHSRVARIIGWRPFAWIGRRTYFVYTMHLAILMFMFDVLHLTSLPAIAGMIVVTIGLSGISYRFYEEPAREIGYRLSRRLASADHERRRPAS